MGETINISIENKNKKNIGDIKKELVKRGFEIENNIYPQKETFRVKDVWDVNVEDYSKSEISRIKRLKLLRLCINYGAFIQWEQDGKVISYSDINWEQQEKLIHSTNLAFIRKLDKLVVALLEILGEELIEVGDFVGHTFGFYYKDLSKVIQIMKRKLKPEWAGNVRWPRLTKENVSNERINDLIDDVTGFKEKINEINCLWFTQTKKMGRDFNVFTLYDFLDKNFGEKQK